ncbi:DNA polymerase III epsilon subunit [Rubrivivax sp. A210]|uniref:DNA polymerase III subunit epsilon n=1 Tax=Rubrivivax sp. A210 TaxID=2772301 RepID=UPI001919ABF9|nr:DNA polymerase III subunit epsilon [Rubrivivax sp. A210]CAD5371735.1 DNA polymerase III epsilon subunit [Rubrivivax sp. A210]
MRQIFLDTETTGLNPDQGDRLIEIGCIEMIDRRATGVNLHRYVNPQRSSHPDALRVHGITDEFLADKPLFADIADELLAYLAGAEIVIHNAAFDVGFIDAELARLGRGRLAGQVARITDSLTLARETFPGKSNSLDALCKRLEVDNSQRELHGALLDAGLLAEVYLRMTRGQKSLVIDSEEASRGPAAVEAIDLGSIALPVLAASAEEEQAHQALLAEIDKASGGKTLWRRLEAA